MKKELKDFVDKKVKIVFKRVKGTTDPNESNVLIGTLRYGDDGTGFIDYYVETENTRYGINTNFIKKVKELK